MYTGIVETTTRIADITALEDGSRIRIETPDEDDLDLESELEPDDSVAVDGVCVTAERVTDEWFEAFLSAETVDRTTLADRGPGDRVNIERPVAADGRFHGHVVTGTVDATTEILGIDRLEEGRELTVAIPEGYEGYVVEKGAVALDGISLTVARVDERAKTFGVATVPATEAVTTLSEKRVDDRLNFEADVVAKYAARQVRLAG